MKCAPSEELAPLPSSPLSLHPSDKSSEGIMEENVTVGAMTDASARARVPGLS